MTGCCVNPNSPERWDQLRRAVAEQAGQDPESWPQHGNVPLAIAAHVGLQKIEIERLKAWVADLHSGMYINCVYCGHRYGPKDEVPASMADALREHVEQCPDHPMSALKAELHEELADLAGEASLGELAEWATLARAALHRCKHDACPACKLDIVVIALVERLVDRLEGKAE